MEEPVTLGIDVGSSAVKLVLLDVEGNIDMRSFADDLLKPGKGPERIHRPATLTDWIWEGVKEQLRGWIPPGYIQRVCITAHGQSGLLVMDGKPHGPLIPWWAWMPKEVVDEQAELLGTLTRDRTIEAVLPPRGSWLPGRLRQLALELGRCPGATAIQLKDLLNLQLTGNVCSDPRSLRGWIGGDGATVPPKLERWIGLGEVTPENISDPRTLAGHVTRSGAHISGLEMGTEVCIGCDDFTAALVSMDEGNRGLLNLATTSEHLAVVASGSEPHERARMRSHALKTGLSYLPRMTDQYPAVLYSSTNSGGVTLLRAFPELPDAPTGVQNQALRTLTLLWLTDEMGEPPTLEELESLPRFDAEIEGRRGLEPDPDHIGGWETDPNESGIDARLQGWRIVHGLVDALEPIREALKPYTEERRMVRMAGGLAMVGPVIEARAQRWPQGIELVGGAEPSGLGAARLARSGL